MKSLPVYFLDQSGNSTHRAITNFVTSFGEPHLVFKNDILNSGVDRYGRSVAVDNGSLRRKRAAPPGAVYNVGDVLVVYNVAAIKSKAATTMSSTKLGDYDVGGGNVSNNSCNVLAVGLVITKSVTNFDMDETVGLGAHLAYVLDALMAAPANEKTRLYMYFGFDWDPVYLFASTNVKSYCTNLISSQLPCRYLQVLM